MITLLNVRSRQHFTRLFPALALSHTKSNLLSYRWALIMVAILITGAASPCSAQTTYGPTQTGDNLWDITRQVYLDADISREQVILALLKANPHAFSVPCNAASYLRIGVMLTIPPLAEIQALSKTEAKRLLTQHKAEWQTYQETGQAIPCPSAESEILTKPTSKEVLTAKPIAAAPAAVALTETPAELPPPTRSWVSTMLVVGIVLTAGLLVGQLARTIGLPKFIGYLLAGVALNPQLLQLIPTAFAEHTEFVTDLALSLITFGVGGMLLFSFLKTLGKTILSITILEAELALLFVALGLMIVFSILDTDPNVAWASMAIPLSILLAALASPTDPSTIFAMIQGQDAPGGVALTIMGVAAIDNAVCLINFSLAVAIADLFVVNHVSDAYWAPFQSAMQIFAGIGIGVLGGLVLNTVTPLFQKHTETSLCVLIVALLALVFGINRLLGLDELLGALVMGCMVVNFNPLQEQIFETLRRFREDFVLCVFFTLSGLYLNFSVLAGALSFILLFVLLRTAGKVVGTWLGATLTKAPEIIRKYAAFGLIPQGGLAIGLALSLKHNPDFTAIADTIMAIVIGATVIHQLLGPPLVRTALRRGGEIA